jgi:apolipoprotein N-acyltransferase
VPSPPSSTRPAASQRDERRLLVVARGHGALVRASAADSAVWHGDGREDDRQRGNRRGEPRVTGHRRHDAPRQRILVSICYEDLLAEATREAVIQGHPDLLFNLTSDAWFDGSRIPYLHLELAKLRTIEHRRFLVHATNTGVTAVFDPAGRTAFLLPARQEASGVARVAWVSGYTPYEAMGDVPLSSPPC